MFLLLESSAVPIINSTLLLFTGALANLGHLDFWALAIVSILGSISGACLAYIIGRRGGRRLFLRLVGIFHVSEDHAPDALGVLPDQVGKLRREDGRALPGVQQVPEKVGVVDAP